MTTESFAGDRSKMTLVLVPDLEVFEAFGVHFVEEEVWKLLAQLVKAEEETLHVAELQFGLLARRVLSVLHLFWRQRHELLQKNRTFMFATFIINIIYSQRSMIGGGDGRNLNTQALH